MTISNEELIRFVDGSPIPQKDEGLEPPAVEQVPFRGMLFNRLLTALDGETFSRLLPHAEFCSLAVGEDAQSCGDNLAYAVFPESAVLAHVCIFEDGSSTGASLVGNDGVVGLSAILSSEPTEPRWMQVIIAGQALKIRLSAIRQEFARAGSLQRVLFSYTNARLEEIAQRVVCNGRHLLIQRLCSWLLMIKDRTTDEQLPLTHEQISMHLGARRSGVTNICNALKDAKIIAYRRGSIRILDRTKLESAACECYKVLKLLPKELAEIH